MGPWTKIAALFVLSAPLGLFASACAGTEPSTEDDQAADIAADTEADTAADTDEVPGEASSAAEFRRSPRSRCEFRCREDYNRCWHRSGRGHGRRSDRDRRCRSDFEKCMGSCRRL